MEIFLDILGEIAEMLKLVDGPTDYMISFTVDWFPVLVIFAIFAKKKRKAVFRFLAPVPLINFAVFYLINFTKGVRPHLSERTPTHERARYHPPRDIYLRRHDATSERYRP